MSLNLREFWTVMHGMILGAIYLLAFAGGFAGLWSLRRKMVTPEGLRERMRRLKIGLWAMAVICWLATISGTLIVYPWYRAKVPDSPRSMLLADESKADWHRFGMEWKEHIAWISPILATAAAAILSIYGAALVEQNAIRNACLVLFVAAFGAAGVAGLYGAFLNKVAPIL